MPPHGWVDVHQHLWPPALVDALRARRTPPYLDGWTLHVAGEPPFTADPADHDVTARADLARADGLDLAVVALSAGLGVHELAPDAAGPLLDAWHGGALALPAPFRAWAAAGLVEPDPGGLDTVLGKGFAGLELPATALADPAGWERCGPLLEVLERRGLPLLVHPAPAGPAPAGTPPWWTPVVGYVPQVHAAWFAFRAAGRGLFPRLRVCFPFLAGLAPLHGERVRARGGTGPDGGADRGRVDPEAFVDTSSYGPRAIDAVVRVLGIDVVVHGSDRPWAAAPPVTGLGDAADAVVHRANPLRLLHGGTPHDPVDPSGGLP